MNVRAAIPTNPSRRQHQVNCHSFRSEDHWIQKQIRQRHFQSCILPIFVQSHVFLSVKLFKNYTKYIYYGSKFEKGKEFAENQIKLSKVLKIKK